MYFDSTTMIIFPLLLLLFGETKSAGILYPRASETREIVSLDGFWNFALTDSTNPSEGHAKRWYEIDFRATNDVYIQKMPVPASYNDIGTDADFRDHVGPVWYQRNFYVPKSWNDGRRVWLRFSSVCRGADVWINGELAVTHDIGHLPFQAEISSLVDYGSENIITVAVDNTLLNTTIPQGTLETLESGRIKQTYTFDFFNYGGIDRPVVLYTTPQTYIDDITISTDVDGSNGFVGYDITIQGSDTITARISLLDKSGADIVSDTVLQGSLFVPNANFWWPYLMDADPGYLYNLKVEIFAPTELLDSYILPVGIRTITWDSKSVKINGKNIYMRGFGRHEDSDIKGKGLDLPLIIRDHNLIRWIGANSYRTSHYPYAEEIMDIADELGIMIIDESPAVNTEDFSEELLENHKRSLTELIQRDKNRPGVIIWSASNEPRTQLAAAEDYYKQIIQHIKSLDSTRPVTVVNAQLPDDDLSGQFLDIASCNVYHGWYYKPGDLDLVITQVLNVTRRWNELHDIPVMMTEYGADTLEGLHMLPSLMWSEEFQEALMAKYFQAFDQMRAEGFFIGEMIWNFADFKTDQTFIRVGGNKKGIFTRNRQPKASAHFLRKRYWALAQYLDGAEVPDDLEDYIFSGVKDEL